MKTQFKVTESLHGWSRLETTFVVESSPRWWQFWKPKVMHQEFNGSVWLKRGSSTELCTSSRNL